MSFAEEAGRVFTRVYTFSSDTNCSPTKTSLLDGITCRNTGSFATSSLATTLLVSTDWSALGSVLCDVPAFTTISTILVLYSFLPTLTVAGGILNVPSLLALKTCV